MFKIQISRGEILNLDIAIWDLLGIWKLKFGFYMLH